MKHLAQYFLERLNIQPLNESGASGHMLHPQDVDDFTGYDIEELIQKVFGGELEGMTEKMDGFGIQASMNRNGEVVFIRNKTQLNSEKGGMTIDDFPRQWDDNPKALENYTKGARVIEEVFKKIGSDWFNPDSKTRRVANCECILEGVTNTIPYATDQVDFHNIWIYEWNGEEWINTDVTKKGLDVIEKACDGIDKVQLTPQVIIKYSQETEKLKEKWMNAWQKFLKDHDCSEDMTIEAIKYSLFFKWAEKDAAWLITDHKAAMDCCKRWLFGDRKSTNLKDLKAIYQDHIDEFSKFEKSPSKVSNAVCFPLQKFFYGMGADVVKVTSGLVNDGRDDVVKSLLKDLEAATEKIKKEGSMEDNEFLQTWLDVLDEIGQENLSSAEGVVFSYKGKMMKFTGGFVPLNRIIGYSKYTMKPKSLQESLFDKDLINKKIVPEKLAYVLRKFFGDKVALCKDHQGNTWWYEVNPDTVIIKDHRNLFTRFINYCKKVNGLDVKPDVIAGFGIVKGYMIGDDVYYIYINTVKYGNKRIRVSKEFYESGALPQDQTGVVQRGWAEWQRQRL